jgi:hypothetical protein
MYYILDDEIFQIQANKFEFFGKFLFFKCEMYQQKLKKMG